MPPAVIGVSGKKSCPFVTMPAVTLAGMMASAGGGVSLSVSYLACVEDKCALWDLESRRCSILSIAKHLEKPPAAPPA
jgi:hypothetical protein